MSKSDRKVDSKRLDGTAAHDSGVTSGNDSVSAYVRTLPLLNTTRYVKVTVERAASTRYAPKVNEETANIIESYHSGK